MSVDMEMKNAVNAADTDAQYDEKAKRLLGNKTILAHILVKTVDEFQGMRPEDVVSYIEGDPIGYHILNRAVFYVSRLISSQKERDFVKMNYNDIWRVYSIWVCMGMDESSMAYVHLAKDDILGSHQWEGGLGLLNIVMIGIEDELPEHDDKYELHRLLSAVLSMELSVDEKLGILEMEYGIPLDDKMRKDVVTMCNLSQGIREKGRAEGEARSEARFILSIYEKGYSLEQIADVAGKSIEEVDAVIKGRELVLV